MSVCEFGSADVELYFYGELDPAGSARLDSHFRGCAACRQHLEDLDAIRGALASRSIVDAPPAGDWSGFMRRLDAAVVRPTRRAVDVSTQRSEVGGLARTSGRWRRGSLVALAATLALVAIGLVMAARLGPVPAATAGAPRPAAAFSGQRAAARPDHALREASAEHLERSKLVVLGLATRDPHARAEDWQYERALAGTLLSETRLYRQAALQDGVQDVERVMRDLETVLLEASMSNAHDRAALERVQRLIARRDLVLRMQVVAAGGAAGD